MTHFHIGRHVIGGDEPTYFIADIAANHDGSLSRAVDLIGLAAQSGANAAKFQNFRAETIVSDVGFRGLGEQASHQASWKASVFEVYQSAAVPLEWSAELAAACDEAGIDYFTAPYDLELIDALSPLVCAWKVGSGDITWHEALRRMARDGKPVLLATGASDWDEVRSAMSVLQEACDEIVLMQCNTNYTASVENFHHVALNVLKSYAREYPDVVLGLSDHTPGHATALGAVALGARVIEKHFSDDTLREGPDHRFSMDAASWREMVDRTRELEAALGTDEKRVMDNERETVVLQRRSLRAARDLPAGTRLTAGDLIPLRPCPVDGLAPHRVEELLGRITRRSIAAEEHLRLDDVT